MKALPGRSSKRPQQWSGLSVARPVLVDLENDGSDSKVSSCHLAQSIYISLATRSLEYIKARMERFSGSRVIHHLWSQWTHNGDTVPHADLRMSSSVLHTSRYERREGTPHSSITNRPHPLACGTRAK